MMLHSVMAAFSTALLLGTTYFPDNVQFLKKNDTQSITEAQFDSAIEKVVDAYQSDAKSQGSHLQSINMWTSPDVNAFAMREGKEWYVVIYGGLVNGTDLTIDGLSLIVCHEVGHHLGGFPFFPDDSTHRQWAAVEGEADYFATQSCLKRVWGSDFELNATYRLSVSTAAKSACDSIWKSEQDQNLCYRQTEAIRSVGKLSAEIWNTAVPQIDTPDSTVVLSTVTSYPLPQCRLDTSFQGALCAVSIPSSLVPNSEEAARQTSCFVPKFLSGSRPQCWFHSNIN